MAPITITLGVVAFIGLVGVILILIFDRKKKSEKPASESN